MTLSPALPDLIGCYWTLAGAVTFGDSDESPWDVRLRAEAAARVGYRGLGLKHADLMQSLALYGYPGLRSILADHGLVHLELEALGDWWGHGEARARSDRVRDDLLAAAAELGANRIKVYGAIPAAPAKSIAPLREAFATIAGQARAAGTTAVLEPICCSAIASLPLALAVLGESIGQGGALMLDIYHVERGGISLADIAALPEGAIGGVEINDAVALPALPYLVETMNHRLLPGTGAFDLAGFVRAVRAAGYDGAWGVEIISESERALPLEEAAARSFTAAQAALTAAW